METTDYYGRFPSPFPRMGEGMGIGADHLGNVRDVITTDPSYTNSNTEITDYYPFGLEIPLSGSTDNQIKYNSKALQTEADLDWYDYSARFYDPVLGQWHAVDPLAENTPNWSPYVYCNNSPVVMIDPDGRYSKFGAWIRNVLWGGEGISKSGKEWGVQLGGKGLDGSFEVVFQTKGSRHWFQDDYIAAWKANDDFARTLDQAGIEYTYTSNVNEARLSHLKAASGLLLANPLLKGATNAANSGSKTVQGEITTIDDLIAAGTKMTKIKGATQLSVKGNVDDIFNTLSKGGELIKPNHIKLPDGTLITKYPSSTTGVPTLQVNQGGKLYKIRVE